MVAHLWHLYFLLNDNSGSSTPRSYVGDRRAPTSLWWYRRSNRCSASASALYIRLRLNYRLYYASSCCRRLGRRYRSSTCPSALNNLWRCRWGSRSTSALWWLRILDLSWTGLTWLILGLGLTIWFWFDQNGFLTRKMWVCDNCFFIRRYFFRVCAARHVWYGCAA